MNDSEPGLFVEFWENFTWKKYLDHPARHLAKLFSLSYSVAELTNNEIAHLHLLLVWQLLCIRHAIGQALSLVGNHVTNSPAHSPAKHGPGNSDLWDKAQEIATEKTSMDSESLRMNE
ncbi:hypothetical protein PGTUg99_009139 [Puccinia graminis f. sp. tritici]|uniref:Uncharacterized protein n=1 Tax=Puccinia graminis f. sp. tritici TaxID=56615 RepID=A0A5B0R6G1_PUCGR|nr:hypothetical protein PGTUg99_005269 [Puccinia graminis f. sp. tritici]KAA1128106.1 hypothetical protein PGTUg99_009139 [Puccinia graminis f. sp. tritici]